MSTSTVPVAITLGGDQTLTLPGHPVRPGLAITPWPDEDGNPTDLYTFTHLPSGLAVTERGMCEICIHYAALNRQLVRLDWTLPVEQLRADPRVRDLHTVLMQAVRRCDRPCTFTVVERP